MKPKYFIIPLLVMMLCVSSASAACTAGKCTCTCTACQSGSCNCAGCTDNCPLTKCVNQTTASSGTCSTGTCSTCNTTKSTTCANCCTPAFAASIVSGKLQFKDTTVCKHVADQWSIKKYSDAGRTHLTGYILKNSKPGVTVSIPASKGYFTVCLKVQVGSCWCSPTCKNINVK